MVQVGLLVAEEFVVVIGLIDDLRGEDKWFMNQFKTRNQTRRTFLHLNLNNQSQTLPHLEDGDGASVVELRAVSVESAHRLRLHVVLVRQVGDGVKQVVRRQECVGDL